MNSNFNNEFDNDAIEKFEIESDTQNGGDFNKLLNKDYYIEKICKYLLKIYDLY